MENLSNNKRNKNNKSNSPKGLLLLLFFFSNASLFAQQVFNKVYTLGGSNVSIQSVAPRGAMGSFMSASLAIDSVTKEQETKILRLNALGELQAEQILRHPEYPYKKIYAIANGLKKIHDNLYSILVARFVSGAQYGSCLITIDSNGNIQNIIDILEAVPLAKDSLSFLNAISYDGLEHIIVAGNDFSSYLDTNRNLLMKFDTSLNLIWKKNYSVNGILSNRTKLDFVFINNKYLLYGGSTQSYMSWYDTSYKIQSLIIATDTSGVAQWHYASPIKWMYDCEATIFCGIATADGGYLYLTTGNVYDFYPTGAATDPLGKQKLIKLDAARNRLWEKEIETFNHSFGSRPDRMMELEDSSIVMIHQYSTDSLSYAYDFRDYLFSRYRADGSLLYKRRLIPPKDIGDTSRIYSSWGSFDFCRMPDKGFLIAGVYRNETYGTPSYGSQKAWLIRLDSNGCLGPSDPECDKTSIPQQSVLASQGFKVYPNPANDYINIEGLQSSTELRLYNIVGQEVKRITTQNNKAQIGIAELPSGMYLLRLKTATGDVYTTKVMKE
ncbi:MAG: T9SS type A sorting domain-containing protein [Chitinophagaceae bacterium]|nr:T9SS type A sorting domain-containing protein [Chitinophagaceae bacterium]